MKQLITRFLILSFIITVFTANAGAVEFAKTIPEPKDKSYIPELQDAAVERSYIIFDNLYYQYYLDTCYIAPFRAHDEYKEDFIQAPFADATFNSIEITDFDVAIFPLGYTGPGYRVGPDGQTSVPANWGAVYTFSSSTGGGIKIIDKINEMIHAGKHVIIITPYGLQGYQQQGDADVKEFVENTMGINYRGKYKCGEYTSSGSSSQWRWWLFSMQGTQGDPVARGQPKYYNGADKSSGQAVDCYARFTEVDWLQSRDSEKYHLTERATTTYGDSAFGIRASYPASPTDTANIVLWSFGFEGISGLWEMKRNMMWFAMQWVLAEPYKPGPDFAMSPNTLNYGGVDIGESKEFSMDLIHTGVETLEVYEIALDYFFAEPVDSEAFTITEGGVESGDDPLTLEPEDKHTIKIKFEPDKGEDYYQVNLMIKTNAKVGSERTFLLEGWGGEPQKEGGFVATSAENIDFGVLDQPVTRDTSVTIKNDGDADIMISVYIPDETNDSLAFMFREVIENPVWMKPDESVTYKIRFVPEYENTQYHGQMMITASNATNGNEFYVDFYGETGQWTSVKPEATTPNGILTIEARPNVIQTSSVLKYTIAGDDEQFVRLKLVDINGRVLAELLNQTVLPGEYKLPLNANLSSGSYFIVGEAAGEAATIPLFITK